MVHLKDVKRNQLPAFTAPHPQVHRASNSRGLRVKQEEGGPQDFQPRKRLLTMWLPYVLLLRTRHHGLTVSSS